MPDFFRNTDTVSPVLFYFDKAATLSIFEAFTVEETPVARPNQTPANVIIWSVVGKNRFVNQREVIAEFPIELYAQIFRDMAEITAAHVQP